MPVNTVYNPQRISEFVKDNLQFSGQSIYFEVLPNVQGFVDLILTDDYLLTGGRLLVEEGNIGDRVYMQIVHPVLGVVNEFISGYRIAKDTVLQLDLNLEYPAKLAAGLSIRCKYLPADQGVTRKVALNLYLHKVLV